MFLQPPSLSDACADLFTRHPLFGAFGVALTLIQRKFHLGCIKQRGPWTLEEDTLLIHYITCHGEGRWNLLAKCAGLKRTGKSCRLRWLNYLKPDIKRGNLTLQEQLLILELHSKWGNRWSKIAQHLPGRTDNEIKNYWRTRVQKQARQLKIESNSKRFLEAIRCFWMPRLLEQMKQGTSSSSPPFCSTPSASEPEESKIIPHMSPPALSSSHGKWSQSFNQSVEESSPVTSTTTSTQITQLPEMSENPTSPSLAFANTNTSLLNECHYVGISGCDLEDFSLAATSTVGPHGSSLSDSHMAEGVWMGDETATAAGSLWNMDELW
ncbi:hypothetical protein NMG60_11020501 [Bertholletia excelsa]